MPFEVGFGRRFELESIGEEKVLTRKGPAFGRFAKRVIADQCVGSLAVQHDQVTFALTDQRAVPDLSDQAQPVRIVYVVFASRLSDRGCSTRRLG